MLSTGHTVDTVEGLMLRKRRVSGHLTDVRVPIKEFFKQPRSLLGAGAYENAGPEAAAMGLKHVLFVTSGLSGTGIIDECKTNFENAGVSVTVYDKVESNPKDYNVMDAYKAFSEGECDGFVSIGG
jgi:formaldehyde dismutase / methanol dehydrogenase